MGILGYSLTSPYGHLYNADTSLLWTVFWSTPRNAKNHDTFSTSIIWTPL